MTILDALADRKLFGRHFAAASWHAWRAFLAAVFALPLDADARALSARCTGRTTLPAAPVAEAWVIAGRRGGKSRVAALVATYLAAFRTYALAPGEVGVVIVVAADRAQAQIVLRYIRALFDGVALLRPLVARRTRESIELTTRITIEVSSSTIRAPRGRTVVAAILDEVAFWWSDDLSANPDAEVVASIRPAMATIPDALILGISTPYARRGVLYDVHRRSYGVDDPRVLVWQAPTEVMNPTIDPAVIAEAYARDPAAARAEYGAEFRSDVEAFLSHEQVLAVVDVGVTARVPDAGERSTDPWDPGRRPPTYVAFVDPAGGSGADALTCAVAHLDGSGKVVVDRVWWVPPPFSPARVVADLSRDLRAYRVTTVVGDRFAGQWCAERFLPHGIYYDPSPWTKSQLYLAFAPMVLSGEVALVDHPRLLRELTALERRPSRVGRDAVDHAPRGHDDLANAVAGVCVLAREARRHVAEERSAYGL